MTSGSGVSAPQQEIRKGLAGVVADVSAVSKVVQETNTLTYRGYGTDDLVANCSFEEVVYLLWHGELPTPKELEQFQLSERAFRTADPGLLQTIAKLPTKSHPMDVVRTAVSFFGATNLSSAEAFVPSEQVNLARALQLFAVVPSLVAADLRRRHGRLPLPPNPDLGYSENFLWMCFGRKPTPDQVKAFETTMILYAEHSFNASTFTARVIASTLSDIYSAITGAIGALKGPLHGGANEAVMHHMNEIGDPAKARDWVNARFANKEKIMGFGHRVYKDGDSRVPRAYAAFKEIATTEEGQRYLAIYHEMEAAVVESKGIKPNLDFPSGPLYALLGFDVEFFTPLFVMSRIAGWTAHIVEQYASNALVRPLSSYNGVPQRPVVK
ncbi:bifunctional 2-methylcitrate synthase/citrate synthase [Segniliparus rugosus]|uniref:Citrate synthase n=1 Tax=Segniliparus rugosus (strain ATCC BAA-974 / DSM 45345 / CCUG 50838 / CIP 108380 / JCM 13579 / CDC 945) TaxID=679197 RepID=E5XUQ8_SEGRC|nr:bifunctional 2-methylcitrate synthase/citrate synthase [Segniliparus rugosus]EFV11896.1 2-methylcitrate synthase/citrate synthase II [Segniliparus rugosus ATCC BAA-974]